MVELKTSEHIAHFMKKNISLGRFDERFVTNLLTLDQITTNQVELFYKIVFKYRRQFVKHELDVDQLIYLPWDMQVIESSPQYTTGHVTIEDNKIYFKSPYNKNFINAFRKKPNNHFKWNKDLRRHEVDYGLFQLKILLEVANEFYKDMFYCDITKSLLNQLESYKDVRYWQPTLCNINGNLYIVATNIYLDEALGNMVLNTDSITIANLVYHGVTIDESVYDISDKKQNFMANMFPKVEVSEVTIIVPWLQEIGCDAVFLHTYRYTDVKPVRDLLEILQKTTIDVILEDTIIKRKYDFPVTVGFRNQTEHDSKNRFAKIITMVDSTPVDIK